MPAPTMRALAACLLAGSLLGWTIQGWRKVAVIADLRSTTATSQVASSAALAQATARVPLLERTAASNLAVRTEQLNEELTDAKADRDRYLADVRSGALRVSIPVADHCTTNATGFGNPGTTDADRSQARAELDPTAAATLDAIAGDGDDATRQLNACIDAYNTVRATYHVQTQ